MSRLIVIILAALALASGDPSRRQRRLSRRCPAGSDPNDAVTTLKSEMFRFPCSKLNVGNELGFVYFCQNVAFAGDKCTLSPTTCRFCKKALQCSELPPVELSDLCSNDAIVTACTQRSQQTFKKITGNVFNDMCTYVLSECFKNSLTGVCDSEKLVDKCSAALNQQYPCDCFMPRSTCKVCTSVSRLCGNDSESEDGSGDDDCSAFEEDAAAGIVYICQNSPLSKRHCPLSPSTCQICIVIVNCDLPQRDKSDLCSNSDILTSCISKISNPNATLIDTDLCSRALDICLENHRTGICDAEGLIDQCTAISEMSDQCTSEFPRKTCKVCENVTSLCGQSRHHLLQKRNGVS